VIEDNCSLLVSSPTHVIPLIINDFKTIFTPMMTQATALPSKSENIASLSKIWQIGMPAASLSMTL